MSQNNPHVCDIATNILRTSDPVQKVPFCSILVLWFSLPTLSELHSLFHFYSSHILYLKRITLIGEAIWTCCEGVERRQASVFTTSPWLCSSGALLSLSFKCFNLTCPSNAQKRLENSARQSLLTLSYLGKAGSLANRIAMLHALAHIEYMAINLSWDIIARFGARPLSCICPKEKYPLYETTLSANKLSALAWYMCTCVSLTQFMHVWC